MPHRDTTDFVMAFAVGAVLGIGATLLLRPQPASRAERILKQIEPYRKRMRQGAKRAHGSRGASSDAAGEGNGELDTAGREMLGEFRQELAELLSSARDEVARTVQDQLEEAQKTIKRRARRIGRP